MRLAPAPSTLAFVAALSVAVSVGCGPKPPRGTPIDKPTMDAGEAPEIPSKREWYVWHQEGLRRHALGHPQEALYCFQRALDLWPKELPDAEKGMRPPLVPEPMPIPPHYAVPLDTLMKLAEVYIALREPQWALHYLDLYDATMPGKGYLTLSLRVQAKALSAPIKKGEQRAPKPPAPAK